MNAEQMAMWFKDQVGDAMDFMRKAEGNRDDALAQYHWGRAVAYTAAAEMVLALALHERDVLSPSEKGDVKGDDPS